MCSSDLVLFSLEQLSYYFPDKTMWQSFVCAMVAAATLQFMNPFRTGKLVLYQVKYTRGWHDFEMIPFCLLGILGVSFPPCFPGTCTSDGEVTGSVRRFLHQVEYGSCNVAKKVL